MGRSLIFYIELAVAAGCLDLVWNQFSLSDYLHLPHVTFLATAGILYIFYSLVNLAGVAWTSGVVAQTKIEEAYPYE